MYGPHMLTPVWVYRDQQLDGGRKHAQRLFDLGLADYASVATHLYYCTGMQGAPVILRR